MFRDQQNILFDNTSCAFADTPTYSAVLDMRAAVDLGGGAQKLIPWFILHTTSSGTPGTTVVDFIGFDGAPSGAGIPSGNVVVYSTASIAAPATGPKYGMRVFAPLANKVFPASATGGPMRYYAFKITISTQGTIVISAGLAESVGTQYGEIFAQ